MLSLAVWPGRQSLPYDGEPIQGLFHRAGARSAPPASCPEAARRTAALCSQRLGWRKAISQASVPSLRADHCRTSWRGPSDGHVVPVTRSIGRAANLRDLPDDHRNCLHTEFTMRLVRDSDALNRYARCSPPPRHEIAAAYRMTIRELPYLLRPRCHRRGCAERVRRWRKAAQGCPPRSCIAGIGPSGGGNRGGRRTAPT